MCICTFYSGRRRKSMSVKHEARPRVQEKTRSTRELCPVRFVTTVSVHVYVHVHVHVCAWCVCLLKYYMHVHVHVHDNYLDTWEGKSQGSNLSKKLLLWVGFNPRPSALLYKLSYMYQGSSAGWVQISHTSKQGKAKQESLMYLKTCWISSSVIY